MQGGGEDAAASASESVVRVLCRTRDQAEAALKLPWLDEVTLDFLEVHGLVEAVAAVKAAGKRCVVATPRVLKPDEERMWRFFLKLEADALLIRSAGMLQQLLDMGGTGAQAGGYTIPSLFGDFSLNAANIISAKSMLSEGLSRLTPTHDLDSMQLSELAISLGPLASKLEVSGRPCHSHRGQVSIPPRSIRSLSVFSLPRACILGAFPTTAVLAGHHPSASSHLPHGALRFLQVFE